MKLTLSNLDDRFAHPLEFECQDDPRLEVEVRLGRARHCDLCLLDSSISRIHCRFLISSAIQSVRICDLASFNGTFVNNQRVAGDVEVREGDILTVGLLSLRVGMSFNSSTWERADALYWAARTGTLRRRVFEFGDLGQLTGRQRIPRDRLEQDSRRAATRAMACGAVR